MTLNLQIDVPDTLVRKAKRAGLLEREKFTSMLERELAREKSAADFWTMLDRVHAVPGEPMTAEEIQVEIDAYRAERRAHRATGS